MRRRPHRLVLAAAAVALLTTGCAAQAPSPSDEAGASASTLAVVAPAGADGYGLPAGTGAVEIQLFTDLSCPYCRMLEEATGDVLSEAVAAGTATLTIHPLNFVSAKHGDDTAWSTRAANALAAALDAGQGDRIPAFYALLQENQTTTDGTTHPSDADILALAQQAGITADLSDAVASQRFGAWVQASNDHWLGSTIAGTEKVVSGVPVLVIDGKVVALDGEATDVAQRVQAAIADAQG